MPPQARIYRSRNTLIATLRRRKPKLEQWYATRDDSLVRILYTAVGTNTVRAFRGMAQRPSLVIRDWVYGYFSSDENVDMLRGIASPEAYDDWHAGFCRSLARRWRHMMGSSMGFGPSRKVPDLIMKLVARWSGLGALESRRLITYLHVPLDHYSLVGIRNCVDEYRPGKTATMGSVRNHAMYTYYQQAIADIASSARVPPIYYDVLIPLHIS
ncbi:MAG: hypothetical protein IT318_04130 [Anaerolineales bacterium]|nr:hypothetical protein [Anaerolineales bacterium]